VFGARVPRKEDARLITGRGRYVSDVEVPRMLHVAFVRSVHAHARIRGVETTRAAAAPGVAVVITSGLYLLYRERVVGPRRSPLD